MDVIGPAFIPGITNGDYWSELTTEHMQHGVGGKSRDQNLRKLLVLITPDQSNNLHKKVNVKEGISRNSG